MGLQGHDLRELVHGFGASMHGREPRECDRVCPPGPGAEPQGDRAWQASLNDPLRSAEGVFGPTAGHGPPDDGGYGCWRLEGGPPMAPLPWQDGGGGSKAELSTSCSGRLTSRFGRLVGCLRTGAP